MICGDKEVELRDQIEVCQGGPSIGRLFVGGVPYRERLWFGGPILCYQNALYLTMRAKGLFFNGFKLCRIDLISMDLKEVGPKADVISPTKIEDGVLYYRTTLDEASPQVSLNIGAR